jgi:hypothetical protein
MRELFFLLLFILPFCSAAQTADEVIEKYIRFMGGEKKWKRVKTIITNGEYDYGGVVFPFTTYAKSPDRYKFVVPFEGKYYAQGYDGTKGWKIDAFKNETKPALLEGKAALAMANEADVDLQTPFINYKAKGHRIELQGTDTVGNKQYYKIGLLKNDGESETYYFDPVDGSLFLKIAVAKNPELQGAILHTYYSDYRDVEGLKFPFKSFSKTGEQAVLSVIITKVKLNVDVKDDEFKPMSSN